jgi:hypothetical protein
MVYLKLRTEYINIALLQRDTRTITLALVSSKIALGVYN